MTTDPKQKIIRWNDGQIAEATDELTEEEPLEIRVRGRAITVAMRTPGQDAELAAGFLVSEGIVRSAADILKIEPCSRNEFGNLINVQLAPDVYVDFERLTRHVFAASSCGLCGKASIAAIRGQFPPLDEHYGPTIDAGLLARLPDTMRQSQNEFARTGGLHAAALFDCNGEILVVREDVGRHNAVDKVIGFAMLKNLVPLTRHLLLVSGRSSFEIMQKALAARIAVVASVSAPSSLAMQFAQENRQTLVGFLRQRRMNVYTEPRRIRFS